MLSEYVRTQPDFFAVAPATPRDAIDMGSNIWCSPGMSNAYLIVTDEGRVVVNTGMWFEGKIHKRNFDAVSTAPTRYIVLTQSHNDHTGGVPVFREDGTLLVTQHNSAACQEDDQRIHGFRIRRSLPFFAAVMGQPEFVRGDDADIPPRPAVVTPDITFDDYFEFSVGGRRFELLHVPGGETIDSLVMWLPDDGVALVGNMFSALFGHFPNLVTMRGDRMRSALAFIASVERVMALDAETLLLGHHGPVRGRDVIRKELGRIRDGVQHVHDATVDAMNRGDDVWTAMQKIRLPDDLEMGQAYGRIDWSVRAIWETYAGWFHQRSTLELYPVSPEHGWSEAVALAGGADRVAERAREIVDAGGDPLVAIRLCEMALATTPDHPGALGAYTTAHQQLLDDDARSNYWLTNWLAGEVRGAQNRIARGRT